MADEILTDYQHVIDEFSLIMGSKGAFEFKVNGNLVYSKQTMQKRHAEPGEIYTLFADMVGPDTTKYPGG